MPKQMTLVQNPLLTIGALLTLCLVLWTPAHRTTGQSIAQDITPQQVAPRVINQTQGFQVESLTQRDDEFILTLKNVSDKPVNGYTIGVGRGSYQTSDLTAGEQVIAPGAVIEDRISASNLRQNSSPNGEPPTVTVLAAFFEDGTAEGSPEAVTQMKERRSGMKRQLERILPLVESALASAGSGDDSQKKVTLMSLRERISLLPEESGRGTSRHIRDGLRAAKQDAGRMLQQLETSPVALDVKLPALMKIITRRISRL